MSLLDYARDEYSQNGDDGIIERIFSVIRDGPGLCCEFGAWDGVHLSNTRALALRGWRAVMIEADPGKFTELERNYADNERVVCVQSEIDDGPNRLDRVLASAGISERLDFLSIDIDGLDYYVFASLSRPPLCVAVEVNAGHSPDDEMLLSRDTAARNVGQPLNAFVRTASKRGCRLVAYNGNAYFVHADAGGARELPEVTPAEAYEDFLTRLPEMDRQWLYRVNLGLAPPYRRFKNVRLRRGAIGLSRNQALAGLLRGGMSRIGALAGT